MDRPPPYFPQSSLNPSDKNRYLKFKIAVGAGIVFLLLILAGLGYGIYYLISWLSA